MPVEEGSNGHPPQFGAPIADQFNGIEIFLNECSSEAGWQNRKENT
jgi:hypothetical protein